MVLAFGFARGQQTTPQASAQLSQLVEITGSTGIKFDHLSSPEQKYIVESMSGGVALIGYDYVDKPGIYFPPAPTLDMMSRVRKRTGVPASTITDHGISRGSTRDE